VYLFITGVIYEKGVKRPGDNLLSSENLGGKDVNSSSSKRGKGGGWVRIPLLGEVTAEGKVIREN